MCNDDSLTLATLCDMVLGENAADRSNDALVRAVGKLLRENNEIISRAIEAAFKEYAEIGDELSTITG